MNLLPTSRDSVNANIVTNETLQLMADMATKLTTVSSSSLPPLTAVTTSVTINNSSIETTVPSIVSDTLNKGNSYAVQVSPISQMSAISAMDPLSHVGDGVFLQTKTAQGLAGVFVWVALFITCQQVNNTSIDLYMNCWIILILFRCVFLLRFINIYVGTQIHKSNAGSYEYYLLYQFMLHTHGLVYYSLILIMYMCTFLPYAIVMKVRDTNYLINYKFI